MKKRPANSSESRALLKLVIAVGRRCSQAVWEKPAGQEAVGRPKAVAAAYRREAEGNCPAEEVYRQALPGDSVDHREEDRIREWAVQAGVLFSHRPYKRFLQREAHWPLLPSSHGEWPEC